MLELWFDKAAEHWEEALPLGNGAVGAMVWSGVSQERVSLNEETLWSGYPQDHNIPGANEHYLKARGLAMDGKYREAQEIIEKHTLGHYTQSYLPLGELLLDFDALGDVSGYRRSLDLESALSTLSYSQCGVGYKRESFVSLDKRAFVMKISSSAPGAVSFRARLACQLRAAATASGRRLTIEGTAPSEVRPSYLRCDSPVVYEDDVNRRGMRFIAVADFEASGGEVREEGGILYVKNADSVVIRLCSRTSFNGPHRHPYTDGSDYVGACLGDLDAAVGVGYEALKERHICDYKELFDRVKVDFWQGAERGQEQVAGQVQEPGQVQGQGRGQLPLRGHLPLPERLKCWETAEDDPALFALLLQYGRYLLISASRPGTLPANLQGIWNQHLRAPWSSNYTININTEMNYWPAEVLNLSECHEPLLSFLETLRINGASTAREHYGANGFAAHHNTDIWGITNPMGEHGEGTAMYAFWPMSGGWLCAHIFEHYAFTLDKEFLANKGWPVIRDAARFFLDVMVADTDGTLIFAPSTSPENAFVFDGSPCAVSKTATMTVAIIGETLRNAVRCCDILGIEPELRAQAAAALEKLPPYKIGSRGELLEWSEELPEAEPWHRHNSHLYPLYPGHEITPESAPGLAAACKRTLELRGDESTGWALAWRVNLWARLCDGERAFSLLKKQLRPLNGGLSFGEDGGCYPNLFGAHPPFQIDSNFGASAGLAEMLLQSRDDGTIILLPALPKALGSGSVQGLRARGGVTVDIEFRAGAVTRASLTLDAGLDARAFKLRYNGGESDVTLRPAERVVVE